MSDLVVTSPAELREYLEAASDPGYRAFHLKTCPQAEHVLGVRLPEQRQLAKSIIKHGNYWDFLNTIEPYYYEEILITGIIIASAPMGIDERFDYVMWFLPFINNWAICDTFCNSFTIKDADLVTYYDFLLQLRESREEYVLRFLFVMLLNHFVRADYLDRIFLLLDEIESNHYYIEMAKAWLVAEILAKFPKAAFDYLTRDQLSPFAHNKAIQKACESRRISDEDKQRLRGMKL